VVDGLEYDDSESPTIGLVPAGVPRAHRFMFVVADPHYERVIDDVFESWQRKSVIAVDDLSSESRGFHKR
jgi:hypothetical protein